MADDIQVRDTKPTRDSGEPRSTDRSTTGELAGRVLRWGERYALLVLLALIVVYFGTNASTGDIYLSHANVIQLIGNQVVVTVVALAALIPLTCNMLDLSTGAICGISSMVCAAAMSDYGMSVWVAIALGLTAGLVIGLINGFLIAYWGLDPIVTTLGMSIALPGLMVLYTGGTSITHDLSSGLLDFGSFNWLGVPRMTFVLVPVIVLTWYVLECTEFGRHLLAIRSNPRSAHLVGVNVARTVLISFGVAGLLGGLAGVLLTARAGSADATTGPSYLFPALAAVMLGVTTIRPGRPNVLGTIVGVFFVALTVSGLSLMGAASWAPSVINGAILVFAAGLSAWIGRRRTGRSPGL